MRGSAPGQAVNNPEGYPFGAVLLPMGPASSNYLSIGEHRDIPALTAVPGGTALSLKDRNYKIYENFNEIDIKFDLIISPYSFNFIIDT
jgi:hypothetical protein